MRQLKTCGCYSQLHTTLFPLSTQVLSPELGGGGKAWLPSWFEHSMIKADILSIIKTQSGPLWQRGKGWLITIKFRIVPLSVLPLRVQGKPLMPRVTQIRRHATARYFRGGLLQHLREVPDRNRSCAAVV